MGQEKGQPRGALPAQKRKNRTHQKVRFLRKKRKNAPGRTRTLGLSLRRRLLYPAELLVHGEAAVRYLGQDTIWRNVRQNEWR